METTRDIQPGTELWRVIDAVGRQSFMPDLLQFLNQICGAEHCTIFRLEDDEVREFGCGSLDGSQTAHRNLSRYLSMGVWRSDPAIQQARELRGVGPRHAVIHGDLARFPSAVRSQVYHRMSDRVMVSGGRERADYCLSIVRSERNGRFSDDAIERLSSVADPLQALIAKHAEVLARQPHRALASLEEIEACLLADGQLSVREAQVSARVLYGLSSVGIALDLGIGEETVKTYRSRAYQRLGVGSPRELLVWYLAMWNPSEAMPERGAAMAS